MGQNQTIMIVAGEDSGDAHGAHLIAAIRKQNPEYKFIGLGGPQLQKAGVEIMEDLTKISVVGFFEILKHYSQFKKIFDLFLNEARRIKPTAVILIDYPGFNLRLAKKLKESGIKVIYYISPQVWAWKKNRIAHIKKYVDKMLVIFSFEKDFYKNAGLDVEFVGHPLIDSAITTIPKAQFLKDNALRNNKITIGLLPGSRKKEVERLFAPMLGCARNLSKQFKNIQFIVLRAQSINEDLIKNAMINCSGLDIKIISGQHYNAINACDHCIVASGTATLETALFEKPMVVVYKTSLFTWILAKLFIKIPHIALVNVIAGKRIVPELIQYNATAKNITKELINILTNEVLINEIKYNLKQIRNSLDSGQSGAKAASIICRYLKQ